MKYAFKQFKKMPVKMLVGFVSVICKVKIIEKNRILLNHISWISGAGLSNDAVFVGQLNYEIGYYILK